MHLNYGKEYTLIIVNSFCIHELRLILDYNILLNTFLLKYLKKLDNKLCFYMKFDEFEFEYFKQEEL